MKYNIEKSCPYCNKTFITRPRYVTYCSSYCKNPNNRPGHTPWNKGIKLSEEQKAKQNTSGLKKGHGWNKGLPNPAARERMTGEKNPNWNGGVNKQRQKDGSLSRPGELNGMYGRNHSEESKEKIRLAKLKNYEDGIYKSKSAGECELAEHLMRQFPDLVWQYIIPNYYRVYDFYIPSLNLIIEYDGDYWHREEKYHNKDYKDTTYAIKEGYQIFRYWESTIKEIGVDNILEDIVKLEGKHQRIIKEDVYVI